jgi:hypothetical protein
MATWSCLWVVNRVGNWKVSEFFSELHTMSPPLLWTDPPLDLQRCSKGGRDTNFSFKVSCFIYFKESILAYTVVCGQVWQGLAKFIYFLILWLWHVNF